MGKNKHKKTQRCRKNIRSETENEKNILCLKTLYFNRYLMIRYALALFVFSNLYWAFFLHKCKAIVVPVVMLLFSVLPCYENFKSYGEISPSMKWTKIFFKIQCVTCIVVLVSVLTPIFTFILPVLTDTSLSRVVAFITVFLGWLIDLACLKRFKKIEANEDKQYKRIVEYECVTKVHI